MDFGVTGKLEGYYPVGQYRKNEAAGRSAGVGFAELAAAKAPEKTENVSFKEMLKSKYPGAYYNVMDTSRINRGLWGRNDYPWDAYFSEPADESVLNWTPLGPEPDMQSPAVHVKLNSMVGKIAIVIPSELEEKMKNDPELAEKVMGRADNFLVTNSTPGLNEGFLMTFDENGEINHACVVGEGRFSVSSSEFVEARKARETKHAEYEMLAEESALKRRLLAASAVRNVKPAYEAYESENYRIVPDNDAGCFDIYNKQGERIGAFDYADIKVRQDAATGKQFLISEHGTMSYDAVAFNGELKEALQNVMGVEALETEELQGFTLKTHSGTGLQYLMRDGEEGRGGKALLQSKADIEKYEALAEAYFNKYPNLVHDKNAAYIWADLEIKGLAQHMDNGIVSMGFNGMSYHDNADYKNNWSVLFSADTYRAVFDWLQNNRGSMEEMQKFAAWQDVFDNIGSRYERIWSDEEEKQGYLNN